MMSILRLISSCFLMLLVGLATVGCDGSPKTTWELVSEGNALVEQGEYRAAIIQLRNAVQLEPDNPGTRLSLGTAYVAMGDFVAAEKELSRARALGASPKQVNPILSTVLLQMAEYDALLIRVEPLASMPDSDRSQIYLDWAEAQIALRKLAEAEQSIENSYGSTIWPTRTHVVRAKLRLAYQDAQGASQHAEQALGIDPDFIPALYIRGALAASNGEYQTALHSYERILELDPDQLVATLDTISANIALGRIDDLDRYVVAAKRVAPENLNVEFAAAMAAFFQGRYADADGPLQEVLSKNPDYVPALVLNGAVSLSSNALERARHDLERAIAREPSSVFPYKLLSLVQLKLGEPSIALQTLRQAQNLASEDAQLAALSAEAQIELGNLAAANEALQVAIGLGLNNAAASRVSSAVQDIGEPSQGLMLRAFDEVASRSPTLKDVEVVKAIRLLKEGDRLGAINSILSLNDKMGETPMVWTTVGYLKLVEGDDQTAREYFGKALQLDPGYYQAASNLASMDVNSGDLERARGHFERILMSDPANSRAMVSLATMAAMNRDAAGFAGWLNKAISADPTNVKPSRMLVEYYLKASRLGEASSVAKFAVDNNPNNPSAAALMAAVHAAMGNHAAAEEIYARLVSIQPNSALYRFKHGVAVAEQGKTELARQSYLKALALKPDFVDAWDRLVILEANAGRTDEAYRVVEKMQSLYPESYLSYLRRGDIAFATKDYVSAVKSYGDALTRGGGEGAAVKRFLAEKVAGRTSAAVDFLRGWVRQHPQAADASHYLAAEFLQAGDEQGAARVYESLLDHVPGDLRAANNLAWLYRESAPERAEEIARRVLRVAPESVQIKDTLGWILLALDKTDEALALLDQAASSGQSPAYTYHYAEALSQAGRVDEARRVLQELLVTSQDFPERTAAISLLERL